MSLGLGEILLILVIAFVVVGPNDLPKIARTMAKGIRQAKMFYGEVKQSVKIEEELMEIKKTVHQDVSTGGLDADMLEISKEINRIRTEKIL